MPPRIPEPFHFFVDECLGVRDVPHALAQHLEEGETYTCLQDFVPRGTPDNVWIPKVGEQHYVVLTQDGQLRYRPNERSAILAAEIAVFMVSNASTPGKQSAARLIAALPAIRRVLRGQAPPLVGAVLEGGNVALHMVGGKNIKKTVKRPLR